MSSYPNQVYQLDFKTFVTRTRFQDSEELHVFEKEVKELIPEGFGTSVTIVSGEQSESKRLGVSTEATENTQYQRIGKSDFLENTKSILQKEGFKIFDFLNIRNDLIEGEDFYTDIFLQKLIMSDSSLWPLSARLAMKTHFLSMVMTRLSLLGTNAWKTLTAAIGISLGLLSIEFIKFAADTQNQDTIVNVLSWLQNNMVPIYLLIALLLVVWLLHAWGNVRGSGRLSRIWKEAGEKRDVLEIELQIKEHLKDNPQIIVDTLRKQNHLLAFIIDDIDLLKTPSFQLLKEFHEQAKISSDCLIIFVLAYNYQNPILHQNDRAYIKEFLNTTNLRDKDWHLIKLEPPLWGDVTSLMLQYYQDDNSVAIIENLKRLLPDIANNPGFFLTFFTKLNLSPDEMSGLTIQQALEALEQFLGQNRDLAQQFLAGIKDCNPEIAPSSLVLLKFILAFKQRAVRVSALKVVMKNEGFTDFERILKILVSSNPRLLKMDMRDDMEYVEFCESYYRSIITSGWIEWQDSCDYYYSIVLHSVTKDRTYRKENPEIALDASPSKLAIELLYRYGEYLYQYRGSSFSDAGYALSFLGCDEDDRGALAKWFALFQQSIVNGDDLVALMEWRSGVRFNPYKRHTNHSYERSFFAPALILLAGQLYRIVGQWHRSYKIWTDNWNHILDKLEDEDIPKKLQKRMNDTNVQIQQNLAEMLFTVGYPGNAPENPAIEFWKEANALLPTFRDQFPNSAEMISALSKHYRKLGVGNTLQSLHFITDESDLTQLDKSLDKLEDQCSIERLRLLYLRVDEYWQIISHQIAQSNTILHLSEFEAREINRLDPELESWINIFKQNIRFNYKCLVSFAELTANQTKEQRGRPNDRIMHGDILYWEAVHLFMVTRLFRVETIRVTGQLSIPFKRDSTGARNRRRRVENAITIVNTMKELSSPKYTDLGSVSPELEAVICDFEEIESQAHNANDEKLISLDIKLKLRILPEMYKTGLVSLVDSTNNQFQLAEAVYQQLGYRSRIASVKFSKGLMMSEIGQDSLCTDEFDYALDWCSGESGYHLDVLRNHLLYAQQVERTAPHQAIIQYLSAQEHLHAKDLGLPLAFSSEVTFRIARNMGNLGKSTYPDDHIVHLLNSSRNYYSRIEKTVNKFVEPDIVSERLLGCHWWLAEMYRRLANQEKDIAKKTKHLNNCINEANNLIRKAKGSDEEAQVHNEIRIVLAPALYEIGNKKLALEEWRLATDFFLERKDYDNALQTLDKYVPILFEDSTKEILGKRADAYLDEYLVQFLEVVNAQINEIESLEYVSKSILNRAINAQLSIFSDENQDIQDLKDIIPDFSKFRDLDHLRLHWYDTSFDILESLSLYASAISLYESVSSIYRRNSPRLDADFERYKLRIIEAARMCDPTLENTSYADFGWIVRACASIVFDPSELEGDKRQLLIYAQKAIRDAGETDEGISILNNAAKLIDENYPNDVDMRIYSELQSALYQNGNTKEAIEIGQKIDVLKNIVQSRDFLSVAEHLEKNTRDFIWALEIAAKAKTNRFSRQAKTRLKELKLLDDTSDGDVLDVENEQEAASVLNDLLELPVHELTDTDLRYLLYDILEPELRKLIAEELSNKTLNWWRERVPKGPRSAAEEKQKRAESILRMRGFGGVSKQPIEYLDFPHYFEIITFNANWKDTFHLVFVDKEKVRIYFQDIIHGRNTISHARPLRGDERSVFVTSTRRILRQIFNHKNVRLIHQDSLVEESAKRRNLEERPEKYPTEAAKKTEVIYDQLDVNNLAYSTFVSTQQMQEFCNTNEQFEQIWKTKLASTEDRKEASENLVQFCYENDLVDILIDELKIHSSRKYGKWYGAMINNQRRKS